MTEQDLAMDQIEIEARRFFKSLRNPAATFVTNEDRIKLRAFLFEFLEELQTKAVAAGCDVEVSREWIKLS